MKSIVVGFADEAGRSAPKLICGPEVSDADQAKVFGDAKRKHRYPKGIARMECLFFDENRRSIAIRIKPEAKAETKPEADEAGEA